MNKVIIVCILVIVGVMAVWWATKDTLIEVDKPRPNQIVSSPLTVTGRTRGNWYFEASFPVKMFDADGQEIPLNPSYIMATGEWMTADFVPFSATLTFSPPTTKTGTLVFHKDNPSGLPENDDSFTIPVKF